MLRKTAFLPVLAAVLLCLIVPARLSAETVKARVLDTNERRGEVTVDVAGQRRTYNVDDRSLYRVLRPGRLVVITAELVRGRHTIVNAEAAALEGRVEQVDRRSNAVVIRDSDTNSARTYYFDAGVRADVGVGDVISFDVEERGPREVITRWRLISGARERGRDEGRYEGATARAGGRVTDVDRRRGELTIDLRGQRRRVTFEVSDRDMLDRVREGDDVTFDYQQRGRDRWVIVRLQRDRR